MTVVLGTTFSFPIYATDCTCTEIEQVFNFATTNPDDAPFMEDELWEFKYCTPETVYIGFVMGDHPQLLTYSEDEDGNQKFLIDGIWVRYDALPAILADRCSPKNS